MKKTVMIAVVLIAVAFAVIGQTRLMATKTAPKSVTAILYYPGSTPPETVELPVMFGVPPDKWEWSVNGDCLKYRIQNQETTFCGTFKIVRTYE